MSLSKRLLKHPFMSTVFSYALAGFIWVVYLSNRRHLIVDESARPFLAGKENAIFTFWHGRMMLLPPFYTLQRKIPVMHVLISLHRDGKLISQIIGHFGQPTVTGSSSKGGGDAMREIITLLKEGNNISITPDGPRGPRQQVIAEGAVTVARMTGKPIVPVTFSASRCRRLNSWDRFMLALPLGRVSLCIGAPIYFDEHIPKHEQCKILENRMNKLVALADEAVA